MDYFLLSIFFIVAFIYSSAGMGGGSSYTALMVISGFNYHIIPTASLSLNLIVTSIGMLNYWRNGHGRIDLIVPLLTTSIPMAYIAGSLPLPIIIFQSILISTLIFIVIRIYVLKELQISFHLSNNNKLIIMYALGAILGFIAGSVGIGGGIYLVPLIIMFSLGNEQEAAATGAIFILVNSIVGIIARSKATEFNIDLILPFMLVVAIGGISGSYFGSFKFQAKTIQQIMGIIIIIAIILLFRGIL